MTKTIYSAPKQKVIKLDVEYLIAQSPEHMGNTDDEDAGVKASRRGFSWDEDEED